MLETLKRRKRGVFREVPVPDSLLQLLTELIGNLAPFGRIWSFSRVTAYRFIKELMMQAGVEGAMACPKGLRHGFAIASIQIAPLPTVQKWMGHARLETTAIYLQFCSEDERELARRVWAQLKSETQSEQRQNHQYGPLTGTRNPTLDSLETRIAALRKRLMDDPYLLELVEAIVELRVSQNSMGQANSPGATGIP